MNEAMNQAYDVDCDEDDLDEELAQIDADERLARALPAENVDHVLARLQLPLRTVALWPVVPLEQLPTAAGATARRQERAQRRVSTHG